MTIPAHIAAHLEEARKAQTQWMHDLTHYAPIRQRKQPKVRATHEKRKM
jgi:hypothetical protein